MIITKVNVKKEEKEGTRLKGFASIVIDNCFIIKNIRIIEGKNKIFVAMPSIKRKEGYLDIAHPLDNETRKSIEESILEKYKSQE